MSTTPSTSQPASPGPAPGPLCAPQPVRAPRGASVLGPVGALGLVFAGLGASPALAQSSAPSARSSNIDASFATAPDGPWAELLDAARGASVWVEFRARYESRRDDRFPNRAHVPTLRTAFGLETASFRGLVLGAELENTTVLGSDRYDDGLNGRTDRPLVLDPEGTTLNRVYADFADASGVRLRGGRIRYTLHDGRLVGRDPWRQNDQVFDGAVIGAPLLGVFDLEYGFLGAVNRPSGDDAPNGRESMATHVLDLAFARGPEARVSAYLVDVDLDGDDGEGDGSAPTTLGLRAEGRLELTLRGAATWRADLARQRGEDGAGRDIAASYLAAELGYEHTFGGGWRGEVALGFERLGGAGGPGEAPFLTPLSSTNDFNGWLDRFAVTPDSGLVDTSLRLGLSWRDLDLVAVRHDFEADRGGADLGREWDLELGWRPAPEVALGLRVIDFAGGAGDASSTALWLDLRPFAR